MESGRRLNRRPRKESSRSRVGTLAVHASGSVSELD